MTRPLSKKGKATDLSKHIAEVLAHYRRGKQLSQRHIAELLGVSFQQYQKYEHAKDRLSLERAIMLCERLGMPLTVFGTKAGVTGMAEAEQAPFGRLAPLSEDEEAVLAIFRKLPVKARKDFIEMIKPIAKMVVDK